MNKTNHKVKWIFTEEEERILKNAVDNPDSGALKRAASRLHKPYAVCNRHLQSMGICKYERVKNSTRWTDPELDIMEKGKLLNPCAVQKKLAREGFKRSISSITCKRRRMDISPSSRDADGIYSAYSLAPKLGVSIQLIVKFIERGWLGAKKIKGTGNAKNDSYIIKNAQVQNFVIQYLPNINLARVDPFWFVWMLTGREVGYIEKEQKQKRENDAHDENEDQEDYNEQ